MIVVDCAAVVDALTGVDGTDDLRAFLASEELSAPALLDFDVVSALRGLTLSGDLTSASQGRGRLDRLRRPGDAPLAVG
ncbi:MAG: hypothetical protein ACRDRZ_05210 [Pseudonocardiaceae bacterium]